MKDKKMNQYEKEIVPGAELVTDKEQAEKSYKTLDGDKNTEERESAFRFRNERYLTICKYVLMVIACGAVIILVIMDWKQTKQFLGQLIGVLSPFFAALLIAYFLSPFVEKINGLLQQTVAKGRAVQGIKYISIFLAYVIVAALLLLTCEFVIPQLAESIRELSSNIPQMYNKVADFLMNIEKNYPDLDLEYITEQLNKQVPQLVDFGTNLVGNVIPLVYTLSVSIVRLLINIILSIMISVYMISGKSGFLYQFKRLIYALFAEEKGKIVCRTLRECDDIFSSFLIGKAVDSLIIGCICCVAMSVLRLPYAVLLSVVVGITNMIPYFGPFIGAVPGILIYLCTEPRDAIAFIIMIIVLQQFDGLVLGPRILGQSTGLSPIWVIFGITVGGAYFGVLGMFIGVPVVAVLAFLINKGIKYRLSGKKIKGLEPTDGL